MNIREKYFLGWWRLLIRFNFKIDMYNFLQLICLLWMNEINVDHAKEFFGPMVNFLKMNRHDSCLCQDSFCLFPFFSTFPHSVMWLNFTHNRNNKHCRFINIFSSSSSFAKLFIFFCIFCRFLLYLSKNMCVCTFIPIASQSFR